MKKPRPHQIEAIDAVVKGFKTHDRGKLIMACGTGKTLVANWVREKLGAECTLFMAPSIALLAQTLREWRENSEEPFEALAVCSDATVGEVEDRVPSSEVGATVTTDPSVVSRFLRSSGRRVVVCTYQSSDVLRVALEVSDATPFDLAVADEAHRTVGNADNTFPMVVHRYAIPASKKLFMTATPKVFSPTDGRELSSMDNVDQYGDVFHSLSFEEAVRKNLLVDYEVLVVFATTEEASKLLKANQRLRIGSRKVSARALAVRIALLKAMRERGITRLLSFHGTCAKASAEAEALPQVHAWLPTRYRSRQDLWASTVNHAMPSEDRARTLRDFSVYGGPSVLTNARCLGEGVDVPTIDGVVFMDSKESKIDIVQSVGRAMRRSTGKEKAVVVLPVILEDKSKDPQDIFEDGKYRTVFRVLAALREHDTRLFQVSETYRPVAGNTRGTACPGRSGPRLSVIRSKSVAKEIADWFVCRVHDQRLDDAYKIEWFKTRPFPIQANGNRFNGWVVSRMTDYRNGTLSDETRAALETIPWWIERSKRFGRFIEHRAEHNLSTLERFVSINGRLPVNSEEPCARKWLAHWPRVPAAKRPASIDRRVARLLKRADRGSARPRFFEIAERCLKNFSGADKVTAASYAFVRTNSKPSEFKKLSAAQKKVFKKLIAAKKKNDRSARKLS